MVKKNLTEAEVKEAQAMFARKFSVAQVAKFFNTNKPSIMKSLGIWNSKPVLTDKGVQLRMKRGKLEKVDVVAEAKSVLDLIDL